MATGIESRSIDEASFCRCRDRTRGFPFGFARTLAIFGSVTYAGKWRATLRAHNSESQSVARPWVSSSWVPDGMVFRRKTYSEVTPLRHAASLGKSAWPANTLDTVHLQKQNAMYARVANPSRFNNLTNTTRRMNRNPRRVQSVAPST
jgi:hypothetical protein